MPAVLLTIKIAFILTAIGLIIFTVGFVSPHWYYRELQAASVRSRPPYMEGHVSYGLWTYCRDTVEYYDRSRSRVTKVDDCWSLLNNPQWINDETRVTQVFETIGLLLVIGYLVLLLVAVFVGSCKDRKILYILSAVFCFAAAGSIILGTIVYGTAEGHKPFLSWAFALAIVGGVIFTVAGIFIIIGGIFKSHSNT